MDSHLSLQWSTVHIISCNSPRNLSNDRGIWRGSHQYHIRLPHLDWIWVSSQSLTNTIMPYPKPSQSSDVHYPQWRSPPWDGGRWILD